MSLHKEIWNAFMLYTSTQLLLVSAVILLILTVPFGIFYSSTVVVCYIVSSFIWEVNIKDWVRNLKWPQFYRTPNHRNYSGVVREVEQIKRCVSKSFIHSWTTELQLDNRTKAKVSDVAHLAIDRLLSLVSNRQFNIYDFITDLIQGAHLHVISYNKARIDPMPRKSAKASEADPKLAIYNRFIDSSLADWISTHSVTQEDYFRAATVQILCKFLPVVDLSPLGLEALRTIISDNVFDELAKYLCQQDNLLKLVIRVLSDDFETLLRSAEIKQRATDEKNSEPDVKHVAFSLAPASAEEAAANGGSADVNLNDTESLSDNESTTSADAGNEYVSDELMKYFKLAPNSLSKTVNGGINSTEQNLPHPPTAQAAHITANPRTIPALMVAMPALHYENNSTTSLCSSNTLQAMPAASAKFQVDESVDVAQVDEKDWAPDTLSIDSGFAHPVNSLFIKFRSVSIPEAITRQERQSSNKYTLYAITYQGVYRNEDDDTTFTKERKVFRRYREFVNLRARLDKSPQYNRALKSIHGPSWWDQVSLNTRRAQEVKKRRISLERFIRELVWQRVIHLSKDLEEFLAYNGGAEIEFVQEKVEIIPQAVRLDKVVIRTVSGVLDKVSDKLSSQSNYSSAEVGDNKKLKPEFTKPVSEQPPVFCVSEKLQSDLLCLVDDHKLSDLLKPEFKLRKETRAQTKFRPREKRASRQLAESLFQILLLLLQEHLDITKNDAVVSVLRSLLIPYLTHWLRNKVNMYSTPQELSRLLVLFRETIWPEEEEEDKQYDLEALKRLAIQCVLEELPAPVTSLIDSDIRKLIDDVLDMTENCDINRHLIYTLVAQLLNSSLSTLLA